MKKVVFKKLEVKEFKRINSLAYDFSDKTNLIEGSNGSGKTTLLDSIFWVLFSKDLEDRSKFPEKYINPDGTVDESKTPTVALTVSINDKLHTFKKVLMGDIKTCYIDDVPYKVNEYTQFIEENICKENEFKLFISPTYFSEKLSNKEERDLFLGLFELPPREKIIKHLGGVNLHEKLTDTEHSVDKLQDMANERIKNNKDAIKVNDGKLSAYNSILNSVTEEVKDGDTTTILEQLFTVEGHMKALDNTVRNKSKLNNDYYSYKSLIDGEKNKLDRAVTEKDSHMQMFVMDKEMETKRKLNEIEECNETIELLVKKSKEVSNTCSLCGALLSVVKVKEVIDSIEVEIQLEENTLAAYKSSLKETQSREFSRPDLEHTISVARKLYNSYDETFTKMKLITIDTTEENTKRDTLMEERNRLYNLKKEIEDYNRTQEIFKNVQAQSRAMAVENEDMNNLLESCTIYNKKSAEILVSALEKEFATITIDLFENLKNGKSREIFTISKEGVPYAYLNATGKVQAGLELLSFIKRKSGKELPVIIDNVERYTDLVIPEGQNIFCMANYKAPLGLFYIDDSVKNMGEVVRNMFEETKARKILEVINKEESEEN